MVKVFMVAKVFKFFMFRQARSAGFMRSASFTRSAGVACSAGFMRCESSVMSRQYSKSPHYPRTRI